MKTINLPSLELVLPREVEIHYKRPLFDSMIYISSSIDTDYYLRLMINLEKIDHKEFFWVLLLNNAHRLLAFTEISRGSDTATVINHKEIFQLILRTNANAFIICHNHPSGLLKISNQDKRETQKLKEISKLMSVSLLDHVIISSESFISFANEGLL